MSIIVLIIILGAATGLITFFVITSVPAPKTVTTRKTTAFRRAMLVRKATVEQGRTTQACRTAETIVSRQPREPDVRYLRGPARPALNEARPTLPQPRSVDYAGQFEDDVRAAPPAKKIADLPAEFNLPSQPIEQQPCPIPAIAGDGSANHGPPAGSALQGRSAYR